MTEKTPAQIAQQIFDAAFAPPREPRSEEYRQGVLDALRYCLHAPNPDFSAHRYPAGSAQADACFSGWDEGRRRARLHLDGIGETDDAD